MANWKAAMHHLPYLPADFQGSVFPASLPAVSSHAAISTGLWELVGGLGLAMRTQAGAMVCWDPGVLFSIAGFRNGPCKAPRSVHCCKIGSAIHL